MILYIIKCVEINKTESIVLNKIIFYISQYRCLLAVYVSNVNECLKMMKVIKILNSWPEIELLIGQEFQTFRM